MNLCRICFHSLFQVNGITPAVRAHLLWTASLPGQKSLASPRLHVSQICRQGRIVFIADPTAAYPGRVAVPLRHLSGQIVEGFPCQSSCRLSPFGGGFLLLESRPRSFTRLSTSCQTVQARNPLLDSWAPAAVRSCCRCRCVEAGASGLIWL